MSNNEGNKTRVILIRHTNTGFHGVYFLGRTDVPITEEGTRHAKQIGQLLKDMRIDKIYSSKLRRSIMTAEEIAKPHGLDVEHMEELNEMAFGVMDGKTGEEIEKEHPGLIEERKKDKQNFRPPGGGESYADVRERIIPVFMKLFEKHKGETVIAVIHSLLMKVIFREVTGKYPEESSQYIGFGCRMYFEKPGGGEIKLVKVENDRELESKIV